MVFTFLLLGWRLCCVALCNADRNDMIRWRIGEL